VLLRCPFALQAFPLESSVTLINPLGLRPLPQGGGENPGSKSNLVQCENFLPSQGGCRAAAEGYRKPPQNLTGEFIIRIKFNLSVKYTFIIIINIFGSPVEDLDA
jgi:hypothetical protein